MVNKQLPAKEVYKRLKFKEQMQKKVAKAKDGIKKAYQKLEDIQKTCPHYDSEYRNHGSTGNWDRDDSYWRNYECHDCGKKWQTDQSYEQYEKYPYAVDKTYER
jgi:transposase-like protein